MKLFEPIPQVTFWNPRAGGVSRGDRQEYESTNEMTTLLTTEESEIQELINNA